MRTKIVAALSVLLMLGLLAPNGVWARRVTAQGTITVTAGSGTLTDQLVVTTLLANPGLEKTIVQQAPLPGPLFVLPFFVDKEVDNPRPNDLDTTIVLGNTTNAALAVIVTVRDSDGVVLATSPTINIPARGMRNVQLSTLLP